MQFLIIFRVALSALRANFGRSLLTILGIVIGIVAIVLVVSLGQSAQGLVLGQIQGIGSNLVIVRPGRQPEGPTDFADTILADSLRERDVAALQRPDNVPGVATIAPAVLVSGAVSYQDRVFRPFAIGWTAEAMVDFFNIYPVEGNYFTTDDIQRRAKVVVLGKRVAKELFGEANAVGEFVRLRGHNLRVVGVLPAVGQIALFNADEIALLPYATAQKDLLSISHYHEVMVRVAADADPRQVADDIRTTLREVHGIDNPAKDDFFVLTQEDIVRRVSTVTRTLTIFLVAIASIALLVGGVGIMNIMLVSVTERTQEIGLRKTLGATNRDILRQFLLEAVLLTGAGGLFGTGLALLLSQGVAYVARYRFGLDWPAAVPLGGVALGVGVATAIGLIFGLYPARRAARLNPIEALRYE
ncbi:MAG: ABC transporter permease [Candidatus Andersenbacteria bacterium]|nr:ABC transporter permease [Candidatus Andersenbacteria bacterium]